MSNLRNLFITVLLQVLLPVVLSLQATAQSKVSFSFSLKTKSTTSAGVFKKDGTLVRTIWSGESLNAGSYIKTWDGLDNEGVPVQDNYDIKVLSNNVTYNWEGVIGNTLSNTRGSFERIFGMAFSGNNGYVALGYNEQQPQLYKFNVADPQTQYSILSKGPTTYHVAADATNVYWSALDPNDNSRHFVYVTRTLDDRENVLTGSVSVPVIHSPVFKSAIDVYSDNIGTQNTSAQVTGMAVQQKGLYLFVAHAGLNQLHVINKSTGVLVNNITVSSPTALAVDGEDKLWMITAGSRVSKYTVDINGNLSAATLTLTGLFAPLAVAVSPDNTTVIIADGGNSQQVKAYNNYTAASIWLLGTPGGYSKDPTVNNNKFYFNDLRSNYGSFMAFQSDGSFWVGDGGNQRSQHYKNDRQFINNIMYMPASYSTSVDHNDLTRVFSDYLEFKVEYPNMAWKFVKNWGYNILPDKDDQFVRLKGINTLSNGKTYGMVGKGRGLQEIVELAGEGARYTGVTFGLNSQMYPSGDIYTLYSATNGSNITWLKKGLISFDGNLNPVYKNEEVSETSPVISANDPAFRGNITTLTPGEITSTGKFISFDGNSPPQGGTGYHIGAVKNGKWMWKSAYVTHKEYSGPYPTDGSYDIGNGVNEYSGSKALVQDNIIIWGYHGEFWKNGQVNKWNLLFENGLFIGQLGVVAAGTPIAGMAGNSFSASLVKVGEDFYLYHNDESYRSGVHRWKISGINTIKLQTAIVLKNLIQQDEGIDLMEGLPFNTVLQNNTNGWTRIPVYDDKTDPYSQYWISKTSVQTITKTSGRDVYAYFRNSTGTATINRSLPTNTNLNSWSLNGKINFSGNNGNNGFIGGVFFEVVDDAGRVIVRLGEDRNYVSETNIKRILWANNQTILGGKESDVLETLYNPQKLNISGENGLLTITYGTQTAITATVYDPLAKWQNPKSIRLFFFSSNSNYDRMVGISDMKFKANEIPRTFYTDYFRTITSGEWQNRLIWESSKDGQTWMNATMVPDFLASGIDIRSNHSVQLKDSLIVSKLNVSPGGLFEILPTAVMQVNDFDGDDIVIASNGKMIIDSDARGTGRIGKSSGNIIGNVTVQRYLSAKNTASYRMLAPTVNSSGSIRDNWQQGVNNSSIQQNINPSPGFGTHITGSVTGANGFDATEAGQSSLFTYNRQSNTPIWLPVQNTNVEKLDAKTSYLLFVRGNRGIDLNKSADRSTNTTLVATGSLVLGPVIYSSILPNGSTSALANPYASPIDWVKLQAANNTEFENYYTMWDPNVGSKGGYVTVDVTGGKSVLASQATTDIQTGQAFIVKSKKGIAIPKFVINEDDKSSINNPNVFRTTNTIVPKLYSSLYFIDETTGVRSLADGVLSRFDQTYTKSIDGNDAEDISNFDENLSLLRSNQNLSIESTPIPQANDTLFLNINNMKQRAYEWQFDASDFIDIKTVHGFLTDKYLGTEIPIELEGTTVIVFGITSAPDSYRPDRFRIVFEQLKTMPVSIISISANKHGSGINLEWKTANEINLDKYAVERSTDGQHFIQMATSAPTGNPGSVNNYIWFDANPINGFNYFRIKSVDKDGSVQYSKTVRVLMDKFGSSINIFPNPVIDTRFEVKVNNLEQGDYQIALTNAGGQTIFNQLVKHQGGDFNQNLSLSQFAKGIYQFSLKSSKQVKTKNLIKL